MQQNNDQNLNKKIISELATRLMNRTNIEHNKINSFTNNLSEDSELLEKLKDRSNHMMSEVEIPLQNIILRGGLQFNMTKLLIEETLQFFKDIRGANTIEELEEKIDQGRPMAVFQPQIHPLGEQEPDNQNGCCVTS